MNPRPPTPQPPLPSRPQGAPAWQTLTEASADRLVHSVRPWMMLSSSMTLKLGEKTGQTVTVGVLRHEPGRLHPDEHSALCAHTHERMGMGMGMGMVREVSLYSGGIRLLAARTVFLSKRLQKHAGLRSLGQKPLGELLFPKGQPAVWTQRDYARIGPSAPLYALVRPTHPAHPMASIGPSSTRSLSSLTSSSDRRHLCACWARRSLFWLAGEPLLVTELFLPALLAQGRF